MGDQSILVITAQYLNITAFPIISDTKSKQKMNQNGCNIKLKWCFYDKYDK